MIHPKVEQFIEFCEKQPEYREYDWDSSEFCALGRFNSYNSDGWEHDFNDCNEIASVRPRTFGALAKRLKRTYGQDGEMVQMFYRRLTFRPVREVTVRDLINNQSVTYAVDA